MVPLNRGATQFSSFRGALLRRPSLFLGNRLRMLSSEARTMAEGNRDYAAAVTALNTLQSNFSVIEAIRKSGKVMNKDAIPEMREWCRKIGYEPAEFNALNAIHIAGTKGKGSTSAFISSILGQYLTPVATSELTDSSQSGTTPAKPLRKIGLYTSPHLRSVRERIQINNEPLSEKQFARYFFEVWDRLEESAAKLGLPAATTTITTVYASTANGNTNGASPVQPLIATKPVYFRYLTLMAFHAYLSEGVDTAVIECGIGGEYDSTNVLEQPSVAAVTSLGIDHTSVLGETIEEIAWHKAGIFKRHAKVKQVFTVDSQPPSAMRVLQERATAAGLELCAVPRHPDIESGAISLGLAADFQKTNASLAVAVAAAHLRSLSFPGIPEPLSTGSLPTEFVRGLQAVQWGGRCEVRRQGNVVWHLDGGHTLESIRLSGQWFASCVLAEAERRKTRLGQSGQVKKQKRVLLFNQQTRDAAALAKTLHEALVEVLQPVVEATAAETNGPSTEQPPTTLFTHAIFSTNITYTSSPDAPSSPVQAPADSTIGPPSKKAKGRYKPDLISLNTSSSDVSKLVVQNKLAEVWGILDSSTEVAVAGTIEEAIDNVRGIARQASEDEDEVMVLVTGSLHLVGGVLEVLDTKD